MRRVHGLRAAVRAAALFAGVDGLFGLVEEAFAITPPLTLEAETGFTLEAGTGCCFAAGDAGATLPNLRDLLWLTMSAFSSLFRALATGCLLVEFLDLGVAAVACFGFFFSGVMTRIAGTASATSDF